jgi:hypothetical protein
MELNGHSNAVTCRKCEAPAVDVRRDWDNEGADFTYVHADGREHRVRVLAIDAQQIADEELRRGAGGLSVDRQ